ncbi:cytochrome P450 [Nonomuraea spiralis]|uniref:Cytochrome P450 n=1 Tax=Nonomuraea spiralis TaxID=46182 RepID=A0ABV5ITF0_9ACTN|nr:cytochrome P450 [Nonomuraea spiralis]GGT42474.1 cytochrome P450 [Nonomuraea spiralis]
MAVVFPVVRSSPFDPPDDLRRWQEQAPIHSLTYPGGHEGWLVTGYAAARAVLADPRFSSRLENLRWPIAWEGLDPAGFVQPPGFFMQLDPPDHTRLRRHLSAQFTVRRLKALEPGIERITAQALDAMEAKGAPAELVREFALPVPSLVICELLGVPYADRDRFQHDSATALRVGSTAEEVTAAMASLFGYLYELVGAKRAQPADDLLSGLVSGGELPVEEITGMAMLLLVAGHETTASMLGLGAYALLEHPGQLAALRADPSLWDGAVEELLRHLSVAHLGPLRAAQEDVEIAGRTIRKGQVVTLSIPAANRDPERFDDPETLDVTKPAKAGHLAFGHGIHQCLGHQLARIEMRIAYRALFDRFPHLRLAVPSQEVPMRTDMTIYGVHRLPVSW